MKELKREKLTQARLRELLDYDKKTGVFTWIKHRGNQMCDVGTEAGFINQRGYRKIKIDGKSYFASRLAWLFVEGYFPENEIDHEDRVRDNNKWKNLRQASRTCNQRNCGIVRSNTSGVTGVYFDKTWGAGAWRACVGNNGRQINCGSFKTKTEAVLARWEAEKKYNYPNCQTNSSAYLYLKKHGVL